LAEESTGLADGARKSDHHLAGRPTRLLGFTPGGAGFSSRTSGLLGGLIDVELSLLEGLTGAGIR